MPSHVRRHVYLDADLVADLERMITAKGGRRKGYSFSREVNQVLRASLKQRLVEREEATVAPVWQQMLDERFAQLEAWLRPGVWGGATYGTTAALMLLELMCGKRVDPQKSREYFELIRGRAWRIVRKDSGPRPHSGDEAG